MSSTQDPSKRVPKALGTDTQLLGTYSLTDLAVAGIPGALVILVTQVLVPPSLTVAGIAVSSLTIPLAAIAIAVGAVFVYLTPGYVTSLEWLRMFVGYHRSQTELAHEDAKAYTKVERLYPEHEAIERTDGTVVGAVQVSPPTMALATDEEWRQTSEAFADFVNTTLEFPIEIFSTTQSFPTEEYVGRYEERLGDPDVVGNAQLQGLISEYVAWYEQELADRQMTIRDHYVLVPVSPDEVRYERASLLDRLTGVPVLGFVVDIWTAPTAAEERAAMLAELTDRRERVAQGVRNIQGCGTQRVPATALAQLVAEYWTGTDLVYGTPDDVLRTTSMIQ
ncbi:hypothetical protein [Salinirussus salinus]|uniref:hypothetical protein n=1 Tax=Salinirussus salinus TaxID=1198300 RepID=UPI00135AF039|nr:hypothetical protein [Salinirussus salinus]